MTPSRILRLLFRAMLIAILGFPALSCVGCGSDGPGSIHIESPAARRKDMLRGAGLPAVEDPAQSTAPGKQASPSRVRDDVKKKR
jgi:hypothetical protein